MITITSQQNDVDSYRGYSINK